MLFADLCPADSQPAATGRIDQLPGLVPGRVLEGRSPGLAAQRLAGFAAGGNAVHFGLDVVALAGEPPEPRRDDNRTLGQFAVAIGVMQAFDRESHQLAIAQHHVAIDEDVLDLAAIGAAVHPHEAADRAGDRAEEFEARNAIVARGRAHQDAAGPAPAIERQVGAFADPGKGLAQPHHHARHPAIADDQVGAQPQRHDRHSRIEIAQEPLQIGHIPGLEQPFRRAPGLEPDQRGERCVRRQLAMNLRKRGRVHPPALRYLILSARPPAHLVMSPAPRQTTMSPG